MATNYIQPHVSDFIMTIFLNYQLSFGEIAIDLAKGIGIILTPFSQVLRGQSRANHRGVI